MAWFVQHQQFIISLRMNFELITTHYDALCSIMSVAHIAKIKGSHVKHKTCLDGGNHTSQIS